MRILAVDPGKDGFIVRLDEKGVGSWPMPVIDPPLKHGKRKGKRQYDMAQMARIVRACEPDLIVVEKQQAYPGQGVSSTFSTALGYGIWQGIAAGIGIRAEFPHPKTWQKDMLRDIPGEDTKQRSIIAAGQRFPLVDLRKSERARKPHDGKCDALLIAAWARDKYAE
ncbi:hypothetical protein LCGC14_1834790 [marine sediment metagenome]|uniref:Uncharacterized protein n=1 Tax=marine sediment metagenome TaxID=412755 RepID=A0A0F9GF00_9ZZZZ